MKNLLSASFIFYLLLNLTKLVESEDNLKLFLSFGAQDNIFNEKNHSGINSTLFNSFQNQFKLPENYFVNKFTKMNGIQQSNQQGFYIPSGSNMKPFFTLGAPSEISPKETTRKQADRLTGDCELSLTTVNKERVCRNKVIFQDDFKEYKPSKWTKETFIPYPNSPSSDILFNYFDKENVKFDGEQVIFIPEVLNDTTFVRSGYLNLEGKCTSDKEEECSKQARSYVILPPVRTGRITSRESFSFKYGIIEITAKVPQGDWLIPEMRLEPKEHKYGPGLESGRIVVALVRGNRQLKSNGTNLGYKTISSSLLMSTPSGKIRSRVISAQSEEPWHFHYNKYIFTWRPDGYSFTINGNKWNFLDNNFSGTLANLIGFSSAEESQWYDGSALAPFDQEFYISLGLSVGGREFPDGSHSGDYMKPWKHKSVKQMVDFWLAREKWEKTWEGVKPQFKITKIKVTSL